MERMPLLPDRSCNNGMRFIKIVQDVWALHFPATDVDKLQIFVIAVGYFDSFCPRIEGNTAREIK